MDIRLHLPRGDFDLEVDLHLPDRGITVLFGPSGSGKTSVLRCVAGLEHARPGRVVVGHEVWQDDAARIFLPTHRRALGYVFQEASLFEHLDVRGNLAFGLRRAMHPQARQLLEAAVELLGIGHLLQRSVQALSGGERQRVAIARALATAPKVLLLDEPMAALDLARRQDILPWLERLRDQLQLPMLYVTHSASELARLADHVVVLEQGKVRALGPAQEVLSAIQAPVLAGEDTGAVLSATVAHTHPEWHLAQVSFPGGELWVKDNGLHPGQTVRLRVLARDVSLTTELAQNTSIQNHLPGIVEDMAGDTHPSQLLVRLRCGESALLARITRRAWSELRLERGREVWVQVKSVALA